MINIENELTVLNINKSEFINKLERLGATKVTDELLQQRYVYDFSPKKPISGLGLEPMARKPHLLLRKSRITAK